VVEQVVSAVADLFLAPEAFSSDGLVWNRSGESRSNASSSRRVGLVGLCPQALAGRDHNGVCFLDVKNPVADTRLLAGAEIETGSRLMGTKCRSAI
jgi:hypothetical protein